MRILPQLFKIAIIIILALTITEPGILNVALVKIVLHTIVTGYILYQITYLFFQYVVKNESMRGGMKNLLLCGYAFLISFGLAEIIFTFIPKAHGAFVLSTQNWFYYFWKYNDMGYRDTPYLNKDTTKKKIFFLGDSFTAGHGIAHPEDRFSDIVGQKLKNNYEFYNLGVNGATPESEYAQLLAHPYHPDILIWQYYGNDIIPAAMDVGKPMISDAIYGDIGLIQEVLVRGSYFLNYLYWKFPKQKKKSDRSHLNYLIDAFHNRAVWTEHLKRLDKFVQYSRWNRVPMVVVVFPFLENLEASKVYISPLLEYLKANNIPVIDVSEHAKNLVFEERVANLHNLHPSKKLNQMVAQAINQRLVNENIIPAE